MFVRVGDKLPERCDLCRRWRGQSLTTQPPPLWPRLAIAPAGRRYLVRYRAQPGRGVLCGRGILADLPYRPAPPAVADSARGELNSIVWHAHATHRVSFTTIPRRST